MNNIGRANVVILKRPMIEEADDDSEIYTYPVTAATRSQKRNLEAKKFQPTSRVTKPAGRNLERSLAHQESRNQDGLNNRTTRPPSLSPPRPGDDDMEDSATVIGDKYGMSGVLTPSQDKRVQFEEEDDGVYDISEPGHSQKETPLPRPQEAAKTKVDCSVPKDTIPIEMREGKNRFQVGSFLETPVPLPMWQCLDQSPQSKVQVAQAIALSWDLEREKKPAGPKLVGTAFIRLSGKIGTVTFMPIEILSSSNSRVF